MANVSRHIPVNPERVSVSMDIANLAIVAFAIASPRIDEDRKRAITATDIASRTGAETVTSVPPTLPPTRTDSERLGDESLEDYHARLSSASDTSSESDTLDES